MLQGAAASNTSSTQNFIRQIGTTLGCQVVAVAATCGAEGRAVIKHWMRMPAQEIWRKSELTIPPSMSTSKAQQGEALRQLERGSAPGMVCTDILGRISIPNCTHVVLCGVLAIEWQLAEWGIPGFVGWGSRATTKYDHGARTSPPGWKRVGGGGAAPYIPVATVCAPCRPIPLFSARVSRFSVATVTRINHTTHTTHCP